MKTNYPYRATAMKPVDPMGVGHSKEFTTDMSQMMTKPMKKPGKIGTSGVLVDGPFGGKKPVG